MAATPPKSKFDNAAEAKAAMLDIITALEADEDFIKASQDAGDDQQKKIAALMPKVQASLLLSWQSMGYVCTSINLRPRTSAPNWAASFQRPHIQCVLGDLPGSCPIIYVFPTLT